MAFDVISVNLDTKLVRVISTHADLNAASERVKACAEVPPTDDEPLAYCIAPAGKYRSGDLFGAHPRV